MTLSQNKILRQTLVVLNILTISGLLISTPVQAAKLTRLEIKVANARIIFLSSIADDPGPDLNLLSTTDNDSAGPFFVVKGDIVSVDGAPATGAFICRGVVFTSPTSPQNQGNHGVAQVNVSWDIDGRGILMGQSLEFRPGQPAGILLGGTGEFDRMLGTYKPSGAPSPLGDGNFTFVFEMKRAK